MRKDLSRVRTGRASLALLDGDTRELLRVPHAAGPGGLSLGPRQPDDPDSALGFQNRRAKSKKPSRNPTWASLPLNDGKVVRINIPPLTEERRKELVKVIKRMEEESKVALRNLRRDGNEQLKTAKKDKLISEDDQFKLQDEVQKLIDRSIEKGQEIVAAKEKEIMEI